MAGNNITVTKTTMQSIGLGHVSTFLSDIISEAEQKNCSYREFLDMIMNNELEKRNTKRRQRNLSGAHFPPDPKPLDLFDTSELESGITPTQIMQLKDLIWVDSCTNILFLGPPGLGKTMLAVD